MIRLFKFFLAISMPFCMLGQNIDIQVNAQTGAISEIKVDTDTTGMNWVLTTDGTQYQWVTDKYGWGLGYLTESRKHHTQFFEWNTPTYLSADGLQAKYQTGGIEIDVTRQPLADGNLIETYTFTNKSREVAQLQDVGIYTPFNDNYPNSQMCITSRCHAHVWAGDNSAWINALRMGAFAPHLGLVVTEGSIKSYQIHERGNKKANSQYRGVISVNIPDIWLKPGEKYTLSWRIFPHTGNADFANKVVDFDGINIIADRYVAEVGDTINLSALTNGKIDKATVNGKPAAMAFENGTYKLQVPVTEPGEIKVEIGYDGNRRTYVDLLGISSEKGLIDKRIEFIRTHQQMPNVADERFGAYMIYDLEGDSIYLNDRPNCNPVDRDEGAERVGMGVLLAKIYRLTGDSVIGNSVKRYAEFVRNKLQTPDYVTYSSVDHKQRNRGYNYMWVADLYFHLYLATGEKQYAIDGYNTLRSMFSQFGHSFYAIGIPVLTSLESLEKAGMKKERKQLLKDYEKLADTMIANGLNYPAFEVNYEQSIVAPAIQFLAQMYLATKQQKYLDEIEKQMPVLEAFDGMQPSFHLNGIALRHWDGYWFGKRELFGDTLPHYWSTVTAAAFYYYYLITGKETFLKDAENIVRNNLCLFFEDGTASCAYLYPYKIDGAKGEFYDPYANDQDWALVYYLLVNKNL